MAVKNAVRHAIPFYTPRRCHLSIPLYRSPTSRCSSYFSHLREEMVSRKLPYATDRITRTPSEYLRLILKGFLPYPKKSKSKSRSTELSHSQLSPAHHLVYFPNFAPSSLLLSDGTDSLHSPGTPFTRRMWAGGTVMFYQDVQVDGHQSHCNESIRDVQVKGKEGEEKIFVSVGREIFDGRSPGHVKGPLQIAEERTLVFMRDNRQQGSPAVVPSSNKSLKPTLTPDFSHTMVPTRELLFRFSALTFNAHAIHLDKQFCREIEGHRNLLVHGPLTLVLMIECLQIHLKNIPDPGNASVSFKRPAAKITQVSYRNVAPLYAEEEMKICIKGKETNFGQRSTETYDVYDVWIEGRDGGYAVKATVTTLSSVDVLDQRPNDS